jgi:UDP-glucose 4-epimerase
VAGDSTRPVVWVTGGAGYIGANVVKELLKNHATPIVIDDYSTGSELMVPTNVIRVEADIADQDGLCKAVDPLIAEHGAPRTVIHLAAISDVTACEAYPSHAYSVNVAGTYNVADLATYNGCKDFVFISSAAVYGNGHGPAGIYGRTKLDAENMLKTYFKGKMSLDILRLFNVAGAGTSDQYPVPPKGKPNSNAFIPTLARAFLSGKSFKVRLKKGLFGSKSPVRDFIHVTDVAKVIARTANPHHPYGWAAGPGRVVFTNDVGRGIGVPITDLIKLEPGLRDLVEWGQVGPEEVITSVAKHYNIGDQARYSLGDMWASELKWQRSKLFMQLKEKHK